MFSGILNVNYIVSLCCNVSELILSLKRSVRRNETDFHHSKNKNFTDVSKTWSIWYWHASFCSTWTWAKYFASTCSLLVFCWLVYQLSKTWNVDKDAWTFFFLKDLTHCSPNFLLLFFLGYEDVVYFTNLKRTIFFLQGRWSYSHIVMPLSTYENLGIYLLQSEGFHSLCTPFSTFFSQTTPFFFSSPKIRSFYYLTLFFLLYFTL